MKCHYCLERIPGSATTCRYCGRDTAVSRRIRSNRNLMILYLVIGALVLVTLGFFALSAA